MGRGQCHSQNVTHNHHTLVCPQALGKQGRPENGEPAVGSPAYRRKLPYLTTGALLERWEHCQNQLLVMSECAVG